MKFKAEDKVVLANGQKWNGLEYMTISSCKKGERSNWYVLNNNYGICAEDELELYKEPKTETFDIEYIIHPGKPGIYTSVDDELMLRNIIKLDDGTLTFGMREQDNGFSINYKGERFTYEEFRKLKTIYKVEYQENGNVYEFISSQLLPDGEFVVCDINKSYGKIVSTEYRELTEEEIKQYKECWRA